MKTRTLTLVLLAATLPTSLAAQTSSNTSLEVDQVKMRPARRHLYRSKCRASFWSRRPHDPLQQ